MMLPEHKEALYQQRQKIREKENNYVPLFDEQELELWERLFQQSLEQGTEITVTYISDGEKRLVSGTAFKHDISGGKIIIADRNNKIWVPIEKILSIE